MTPEALAALHRLCFAHTPRPLTAAEFVDLLKLPGVIIVQWQQGMALGRIAGPEVELLTLAVHPESRRHGTGGALVREFEARAASRGASEVYLDVAECNCAARALYLALGYTQTAIRPGYFKRPGQRPADGLVMSKSLEDVRKTI
jgi:ribosomal-protein-alanine N-acetyltransferase